MFARWSLVISIVVALTGCATKETANTGLVLMSQPEFENVLERYTDRTQRYEGLYNTLDVTATLRNSAVLRAQLEAQARIYQWDRAKFLAESNKALEDAKNKTEVFLSFYTPERKNDDLNRSTSQWKTYLEIDGRRWEGKTSKVKLNVMELQGWYPYHNRFATPYLVSFPVALSTIEGQPVRFVVTGPMGLATLNFNPVGSTESTIRIPRAESEPSH